MIQWHSWKMFHLETYELHLKLRPGQSKLVGGGGGGRGLTAKPCSNGLMGANELGMCHHNAERPLVHLGARVPMQPTE